MFILFIGKYILMTAIHTYYYEQPGTQLVLLSAVYLLNSLIILSYEFCFDIFKIKGEFVLDTIVDLCLSLLNFILYLKYVAYSELSEILETAIETIVYSFTCLFALNLFYYLLI